ncbi:hypothetical protein CC80DRAFT_186177 [Byssothecium circinans]|uniref:Uncharacterized protein n=1 Tax=Byssothecium circinans TaxID=147558 RepID=A0A6A5TJC6_9PLEO|nr:hypothetical protein CC80DRAFT_186177 [Byssothecium circinans]
MHCTMKDDLRTIYFWWIGSLLNIINTQEFKVSSTRRHFNTLFPFFSCAWAGIQCSRQHSAPLHRVDERPKQPKLLRGRHRLCVFYSVSVWAFYVGTSLFRKSIRHLFFTSQHCSAR